MTPQRSGVHGTGGTSEASARPLAKGKRCPPEAYPPRPLACGQWCPPPPRPPRRVQHGRDAGHPQTAGRAGHGRIQHRRLGPHRGTRPPRPRAARPLLRTATLRAPPAPRLHSTSTRWDRGVTDSPILFAGHRSARPCLAVGVDPHHDRPRQPLSYSLFDRPETPSYHDFRTARAFEFPFLFLFSPGRLRERDAYGRKPAGCPRIGRSGSCRFPITSCAAGALSIPAPSR